MDTARRIAALGIFVSADFTKAYGLVYETKPHRPPVTGWPLRVPYDTRLLNEQADRPQPD
jgi:hypothetical protein